MNFQRLFHVLRMIGIFSNTWPPHPNSGKFIRLLRDVYLCVTLIVLVSVFTLIILGAYKSRDDIEICTKSLSHLAAFSESFFDATLCRGKRNKLQKLLLNIEDFIKFSKNREARNTLQKYTDRYMTFISVVVISFVIASTSVILSPLVLPLEFPVHIWCPFSTKSLLRKIFIYSLQIFTIEYTVSCLGVDIMIAFLLFYSTARLETLASEIEQAIDDIHVTSCIQKHQEIIKFVADTQNVIRYLLFKTTLTMGFTVICTGFPILYLQSYMLIPQFVSMIIAALQRMYITAWAANDLKEVSSAFCWSVYGASWIGNTKKIKSNIFMMLQRSQKPFVISMSGILPSLTLAYYGSFISSVMSYFMTMRAAIAK